MRKIREILRLRYELNHPAREIAASTSVSPSTVLDVIRRAMASNLSWPLPEDLDDTSLDNLLYPQPATFTQKPTPDFEKIHQELRRKGVTLQLLWLEYKQNYPDGLQYSQFCQRYKEWCGKLDPVMRQIYSPGEKMFVDYAGQTMLIIDPTTGEAKPAQIFIAVLGASSYTFVQAYPSQELPFWIKAHIDAFQFFGGIPAIVVPDNLKSGVHKSCRYEPELNPTYQEMADHYGIAVIPARPKKPRDKAKAESAVLIVERWILAALRDRIFFSLLELNQAINQELVKLNSRPFQKLEGSRLMLFETIDRPALKPLPVNSYEFAEWKKAKVNIDYHVEVDSNFYSVPYQLIQQTVDIRLTVQVIEIFHKGQRAASHRRSYKKSQFVTDSNHRPVSHQKHLEWTPDRIIHWAKTVGPNTALFIHKLFETKVHPEQGFRPCLGILRLGDRYSKPRLEAAAGRALALGAISYRNIKSILENGLDQFPLQTNSLALPFEHENLRGPGYYKKEDSLC